MRRGFVALLAALILVSTYGYAFDMPTAAASAAVSVTAAVHGGPMHGSAEVNADANVGASGMRHGVGAHVNNMVRRVGQAVRSHGRVSAVMGAEANVVSPHVLAILKKHLGAKRFQELNKSGRLMEIISQIRAHREHVMRMLRTAPDVVRRWERIGRMYQHAVMQLRQHMSIFQQKRSRWEHYHQMYLRGEIDENTYFQVSKDFVLSAIDTTIARIESVAPVADVNVDVNATVSQLQALRAEVADTNSLSQLRVVYSQKVLPELRKVNQEIFTRMYLLATVRATDSIVSRLDIAAARLTEYQQLAQSKGIADANFNARVDAIFAEISNVKSELNALKADVAAGKITNVREYMARIKQIKQDVVQIYGDIRSLMAEYNGAIRASGRAGVRAGVNVSAGAGSVEQNAGASAAVEVNA